MHDSSIGEVALSIRSGAVTPTELLEQVLERIDRLDPVLQSYAAVMSDAAHQDAARATAEVRAGRVRGPLHGVPVAVKDLYGTAGTPTSFGSAHLSLDLDDAEVVTRLRTAGAVVVGKLRMSEAALTDHGVGLPVPLNPWDHDTWVGTSSSGCGAATAAGLCFASIGSDTGGSVRGPATAAGLTGLKPTRGRVPADGGLPLSRSLDTVGPFARSAQDCRIVLEAIADPRPLTDELPQRPLRIGVDHRLLDSVAAATRAMILETAEVFRTLDVQVVEVTVPDGRGLADDWVTYVGAEAVEDIGHLYPDDRRESFGPEVRHVLEQGAHATEDELARIRADARSYQQSLDAVLDVVDAVLLPTVSRPSPTLADIAEMRRDYAVWNSELMRLTCPMNFSGHPALTMPTGFGDRGTPLGAQLVGRHNEENLLLHLGELFQSVTDHHSRRPAGCP